LCPVIRAANAAAEAKIAAALEDDAQLDFIETPLNQVLQFLQDQYDIPFQIDIRALDDVGVGTDTPITTSLKGVSLHAALQLILGQLDLTYTIENEVLLITTREAAESHPELRVYSVAALLREGEDAASLVGTLQAAMQPAHDPSELAHGFGERCPGMPGGGEAGMGMMSGGMGGVPPREPAATLPRIIPSGRVLIVRHTSAGHREFSRLLETLAVAAQSPASGAATGQP